LRQQNPQKPSPFVRLAQVSQKSQARALASGEHVIPTEKADDLDERAALIEYGAGVPRQWAEGYADLCAMAPLAGFSPERWQRIVDGAGRFMDRWAVKATACGWTVLDVFGVDPDRPDRRFDCMGLLMLLDRTEIVAIDCDGADLQSTGALLRYRRRVVPAHTKPLWELAS
jgi:hypothetical protein